jgi:hypothetical protein
MDAATEKPKMDTNHPVADSIAKTNHLIGDKTQAAASGEDAREAWQRVSQDMNSIESYSWGLHSITNENARISGWTIATVGGNSVVECSGTAKIKAKGHAKVVATESCSVAAMEDAQVSATGNAKVRAYDNTVVKADGNAQVAYSENAHVETKGNAQSVKTDDTRRP